MESTSWWPAASISAFICGHDLGPKKYFMHLGYVTDMLFSGESDARCEIGKVVRVHHWATDAVRQLRAGLACRLPQISGMYADSTPAENLPIGHDHLHNVVGGKSAGGIVSA